MDRTSAGPCVSSPHDNELMNLMNSISRARKRKWAWSDPAWRRRRKKVKPPRGLRAKRLGREHLGSYIVGWHGRSHSTTLILRLRYFFYTLTHSHIYVHDQETAVGHPRGIFSYLSDARVSGPQLHPGPPRFGDSLFLKWARPLY